jgi:hypothetical protein
MKMLFILIIFVIAGHWSIAQSKNDTSCYSVKFVENQNGGDNNIFKEGSYNPYYKGGMLKWKEFLEKNVLFDEILKSIPDSVSFFFDSVILKFIVSRSGQLSDLQVLYAGNTAIEKESLRLVKKSCTLWIPGNAGGRQINTWHIEKLAFIVERKNGEIKTRIGIMYK